MYGELYDLVDSNIHQEDTEHMSFTYFAPCMLGLRPNSNAPGVNVLFIPPRFCPQALESLFPTFTPQDESKHSDQTVGPAGQRAGHQGAERNLSPQSWCGTWRGARGGQAGQRSPHGVPHQAHLLPVQRGDPPGDSFILQPLLTSPLAGMAWQRDTATL